MIIVYFFFVSLFILVVLKILCNIKGIKVIRVFGFELFVSLIMLVCLSVMIMRFILPIPQYYIKQQGKVDGFAYSSEYSLNKILEDEAHKSGISFDNESFKIIESYGMNFNHLFLCTYQVNGEEEARLFHFEKNIFGNMKPKHTFPEPTNIIKKSTNSNDYYSDYFEDGILGGYLLTAGYADEDTRPRGYNLNGFSLDEIYPSGYFMWIEQVSQPWKERLLMFCFYILVYILSIRIMSKKNKENCKNPIKFYRRWRVGDKIFEVNSN